MVLEDEVEGTRLDVLLDALAADEKMIAKLNPVDAYRLGYQVALSEGRKT